MNKVILIFSILLFCPGQDVESQPRQPNTQTSREQADNKPAAPPLDTRQTEIEQAAKAERERYEKERDAKEDASRAEQARINEIVANATVRIFWATVVNVLILAAYAFFSYRSWKAIERQANSAENQVGKMQGQLDAVNKQSRIMIGTWQAVKRQASIMDKGLNETEKTVALMQKQWGTMQGQLTSMKGQEDAMRESLTETRNAIAESKNQTDIMKQSLIVSTRSYMDVFRIENMQREEATIVIKIGNIGNVPAEDITGFIDATFTLTDPWKIAPELEVEPRSTRRFPFDYKRSKLFKGKLKIKLFAPVHEKFSPDQIALVFNGDAEFVAQITIEYRDGFSEDSRSETFAFRFDHKGGGWFTHPVPIQFSDIVNGAVWVEDSIEMQDSVTTALETEKPDSDQNPS